MNFVFLPRRDRPARELEPKKYVKSLSSNLEVDYVVMEASHWIFS
jgi:hypothetical protein